MSYLSTDVEQYINNPDPYLCDERIAAKVGQSITFSQKLMAPPAAPHVPGLVIQTLI